MYYEYPDPNMLVGMFKSLVCSIIKYVGTCFLLDQREMGNIQCRTTYLTLDYGRILILFLDFPSLYLLNSAFLIMILPSIFTHYNCYTITRGPIITKGVNRD